MGRFKPSHLVPASHTLRLYRRAGGWLLLWLTLFTGLWRGDALAQIEASGTLRAAMVNSPTSYYYGPAGETGFDYDVARAFADYLGVRLRVVPFESTATALAAVQQQRVHLAATPTAVTPERAGKLRLSRPLRYRTPQLVSRSVRLEGQELAALEQTIVVPEDSAFASLLALLAREVPSLHWEARVGAETEQLLQRVVEREIDLTVAGSDLVAITRRYYPVLTVVRDLAPPQPIAWGLPRGNGDGLHTRLVAFLDRLGNTELGRVRDRHFGHVDRLDYVDAVTLAEHYRSRLSDYRAHFERAGERHGIDWRLLAAVGYQESHWNNEAISPTGVRGLMQITEQTAEFLGIGDRTNPSQAIDGAARYLRSLHERLPDSIAEPDRSWFMLASYNLGLGHVLDARRLTEAQGGDPDRWVDVRRRLPLLAQPDYYREMRRGYARGPEAVHFVGNVRTYFDVIVWLTTQEEGVIPVHSEQRQEMRPPRTRDPLAIDQPFF